MSGRRVFYLHSPSGDIGHAVHLLRLLAELEKRSRGGRSLIFLRAPKFSPPRQSGQAGYPYGLFKKYGKVIQLPGAPSAASGRRLAALLKGFRPSAVVTEFFPFGRGECLPELLPALEAASACGARLFSSVPVPYFTAPEGGLEALLRTCARYDKILVHCPEGADLPYMAKAVRLERRISPASFLSVFRKLRGRLVFTGYLTPRVRRLKEEDFVLVTRGGGSTSDGLFEAAIGAASLVDRPFLFVAGPATPPRRLASFRALAAASGGKMEILAASADLPALTARAAVCVSTAGGSVYEMLALRKKMVLAPFCGAKGREHSDQLARAWLMRDLAGAEVLLPGAVTAVKIAAAIEEMLGKKTKISKAVNPSWFGGAARAARVIENG